MPDQKASGGSCVYSWASLLWGNLLVLIVTENISDPLGPVLQSSGKTDHSLSNKAMSSL